MKTLKLAIVTPYPPSKITLNEYAYHMVKHFRQKEQISEIVLLTDQDSKGAQIEEVEGCKVSINPCWTFNSLSNVVSIQKAIKKEQADIVLYNIQFLSFGDKKIPAALGLMSPWVAKLMGTPSVTLLHNIIETVDYTSAGITSNKIMVAIFNLIGNILTRIILKTNLLALTLPRFVDIIKTKYKAKNVAWVPHGSFELPEEPSYEIPAGPKKIMTFGKFGTYKKVEGMIEAVEIVRARTGEDIEIIIAGSDSPNVKGYLDGVKETYSYVPQLHFTGYVEEEDVPVIFGESTAVVFPYTSTTGSSGVLHQAGSYGKAAILPNIGDLKELIEEEGYQGVYFDPSDIESLADAIEEMVVNPTKRDQIARKNYAAAASISMANVADWYLMHFEQIINAQKPSFVQKVKALFGAKQAAPKSTPILKNA